ncbi:S8 family peptidase [Spirulina subsalsa FACHB-351]|uniref:S8 family peptidase n=1 Tax=Spirulina subsalsa FACHB-351 TaxID=234711 RepID=A0ABT3L4V7_9CYAN|nr:S8 family peptidase [Spirulina subsalsa]MCW6036532.1 S8 family peptidase [Spirulina subsalsa FACHB-351]
MKNFLLCCLFILGLGFALSQFKGLANQGEYDSLILNFRNDIPQEQVEQQVKAIAKQYNLTPEFNSEFSKGDRIYILKGDKETVATLKEAGIQESTEYIEPNYIYHSFFTPNDPDYAKQWNFRAINLETAWAETKGKGVTVAVIDTGVTQVPDLKDTKFVQGYDFVNKRVEATDDVGHGTHVAGTIAQSTNNNYGVAGIAYEAKIMPIKVLSAQGGGTVADIAEGIRFAADHGADVINMSLGGPGESKLMQDAVNYAYNKGVVIIAAAGNESRNSASYPARYPHVISVSALDSAGLKAPYSNFGAGVDIAAPGGSENGKILQNTIDPRTNQAIFAEYQGTSMAAPHVAGVAALIKATGVSDPAEVFSILQESAQKVEEDPFNHYGAGQLNAGKAVQLAAKGQITFKDFFRWLRENGYLNPRFWIDGGAVALLPKIAMVIGSYLLAFLLRNYFPFAWSWSLTGGLIAGSSGLFFLRGFYVFDLPQAPFRVLGSSIPELGTAIQGGTMLNPLFASVLIPGILITLFLGHPQWKWFAIGSALGVASCLAVSMFVNPQVWGLGAGLLAQGFLGLNALLCFALAKLASQKHPLEV